jgi:peptide/nickel transport system substrate-binding protein
MSGFDESGGTQISRRHVLAVIGGTVAGSAFLAACKGGTAKGASGKPSASTGAPAGGGGGGGGGGAAGGGGGGTGLFQAAYPYDAPPKGNINELPGVSEAITMGYLYDYFLIPGAMYYWAAQKYYYMLADPSTTVSSDGSTLTYKVRSGLKWSDGRPITAQDVYTTWVLEYVMGNSAFNYVDKITKTDNMTVTFHIKQPAPIAEYYLLRGQIVADHVYGKFAKEAEPLFKSLTPTSSTKVAKLVQKVSSYKPKGITASGAFNIDASSISPASLTMVRNPNGYAVDKVNFDKVMVYNGTSDTDVMPLLLSKKIDYATYGFTVADTKEMAGIGYRILRPPTYFGGALFFNFKTHPEFNDKRVRQALAHALNRKTMGSAAEGKSGVAVKYMTGFSDVQVPEWISSADRAKFDTYDYDLKKAAQLLEAAGWKQTGGKWMKPDGKPAVYDISSPGQDADLTANAQTAQSELNAFGFKLTVVAEDNTTHTTNVQKGKFDLAIMTWGSAGNPFPTAALQADVLTYNWPVTRPTRGMDFPLKQTTDAVGKIDFETAIPDSGQGPNPASLKSKITKVALAFNELLPIIPLYERYGNNPVSTANISGYPADSDPIYKNSIYADNFTTILTYDGTLKHT